MEKPYKSPFMVNMRKNRPDGTESYPGVQGQHTLEKKIELI